MIDAEIGATNLWDDVRVEIEGKLVIPFFEALGRAVYSTRFVMS